MDLKVQKEIFNEWLKNHKGILFKIIRAYTDTLEDQEDLFQEITIQLWNSIPNFRKEASVSTWIYKVALFAAMTWIKKEKNHKKNLSEFNSNNLIISYNNEYYDDQLDWLYTQIRQLDEINRSLIILFLEGFKYKEIAGIMGITESNVGVKINRIKKYLSQQSKNN